MAACDIASRWDSLRVSVLAVDALAKRFGVTRELILDIIQGADPKPAGGRQHWRVPVEGWRGFLGENSSLR